MMTTQSNYLSNDEARVLYETGDAAHDFDHVWRVTQMAIKLAQAEGADPTLVRLAALLHDVPVPHAKHETNESVRKSHHFAAADYAGRLLRARGMGTKAVEAIVHCIEAHRFRERSVQPQTLEAKCLYDADKLDSIGMIGVARAFAFAGTHNNRLWTTPWPQIDSIPKEKSDYTPVHEFVYKLRHILSTLHTNTAQRIGKARHDTMVEFFNRLDTEIQTEIQVAIQEKRPYEFLDEPLEVPRDPT